MFKSILVAALALVAKVSAVGVCYDPNHNGISIGKVAGDMNTIRGMGFNMVRTYISKIGDADMANVVANSGLTVALGVPYPQGEAKAHAEAAIAAAKSHGNVRYIFVG